MLIEKKSGPLLPFLAATGAALFYFAAPQYLPPQFKRPAQLSALVLLIIAFIGFVLWIRYEWTIDQKRLNEQRTRTPESVRLEKATELVRALGRLTADQIDAIAQSGFLVRSILGNTDVILTLKTRTGEVPYWFIDEFFELCQGETHLYPVRYLPKRDRRQEYGSLLAHFLAEKEFALRIGGNQPYRWAYQGAKEDARRMIYGSRIVKRYEQPEPETIEQES